MPAATPEKDAQAERITRGGYALIILWAAATLILYTAIAGLGASRLHGYRARASDRLEAIIASAREEARAEGPASGASAAPPTTVHIGAYLHHIGEISLTGSSWKADFDIWFRWRGEGVEPGDNFQIVNGEIESKEKREAYVEEGERYERYRVRARIVTHFDTSRIPFGGGILGVGIEDGRDGVDRLRYVADEADMRFDPRAVSPKWWIEKATGYVTSYRYPSRFGSPRLEAGASAVRSRYVFGILAFISGWGIYTSLFQALFVAVAIAFIAFFIKPIHVDPRFGLGIGAVFAAVGSNIATGFSLINAEGMTLTQMVNGAGLLTIFLTIVQSAVSLWIFDSMGRERLSRVFDLVCFAAFLVGYVGLNVVLPLAAQG